jgi:hypothetical protein
LSGFSQVSYPQGCSELYIYICTVRSWQDLCIPRHHPQALLSDCPQKFTSWNTVVM